MRRYTPVEIFNFAKAMGKYDLERVATHSWITGMLVGIAFNQPKEFPKSPEILIAGFTAKPKKLEPSQWEAMISMLCAPDKEVIYDTVAN